MQKWQPLTWSGGGMESSKQHSELTTVNTCVNKEVYSLQRLGVCRHWVSDHLYNFGTCISPRSSLCFIDVYLVFCLHWSTCYMLTTTIFATNTYDVNLVPWHGSNSCVSIYEETLWLFLATMCSPALWVLVSWQPCKHVHAWAGLAIPPWNFSQQKSHDIIL